jgi:ParB family chromosome partitioning protein
MMLIGVCSAGLSTTQLPAASAGASFQVPFLGAGAAGEIAEMVDRQRQIGDRRLADRLAVVQGLNERQHRDVLFDAVGDRVQDGRAGRCRGFPPGVFRLVRGVEGGFDILCGRPGDLAERLAGDRAEIAEILPVLRGDPIAADKIVVAGAQGYLA